MYPSIINSSLINFNSLSSFVHQKMISHHQLPSSFPKSPLHSTFWMNRSFRTRDWKLMKFLVKPWRI